MKTKVIIMGVVTALLVAVTFKLKSNKQIVEANIYLPEADKKVLVEATCAELKNLEKNYSYTGTFLPNREVMLIPQVHGEVEGVYFNEGEVIRRGALLVQIDDDVLQAQFVAADANYETAKRNLERYENASLSGGVSKIQLDNLRLNLTSAESQRTQLAKQIELSRVTAPFPGTVTLRDVEVGSVVGGQPVARITELTEMKLEISVPEKEIVLFREGELARVQTDIYPGKAISGKIEHVSDRADNSHNYVVRILVKNEGTSTPLKAGMYGTAHLSKATRETSLIIPRAALLGSAKNPQVYVVTNQRAVLTPIHTGETLGESIEVLEGVNVGDTVVTTGHINLSTGSLVEIIK